jgi:hypothetical protein
MSKSELIGHPRWYKWKTNDGESVPIKHMSTTHLSNVIELIQIWAGNCRGAIRAYEGGSRKETKELYRLQALLFKHELYIRIMKAELEYRDKYGWPEDKNNAHS